jgi:hypothetical protein
MRTCGSALPFAVNVQVKVEIRRKDAKPEPSDLGLLVTHAERRADIKGWVALEYEAAEDPLRRGSPPPRAAAVGSLMRAPGLGRGDSVRSPARYGDVPCGHSDVCWRVLRVSPGNRLVHRPQRWELGVFFWGTDRLPGMWLPLV